MFAAAAIVARWIWDAVMIAARFASGKALILAIMLYVLPWAFRQAIVWMFEYLTAHGAEMVTFMNEQFSSLLSQLLS